MNPATPGLSLGVKIMYGAGEVANAIKVVTFGLYSMFFVTTVMGLPALWVGIIGSVTVLWDAMIDPVLGFFSDAAGSASRRYALMLIGALTMGAGYWAFFNPPQGLSTVVLFVWLLTASLVVRTANSMYIVPYYALGANLTHDYHERTSITGIRGMMSTLGTVLSAALSFVLFFPEKTPGVDPKLQHAGYGSMGLVFGGVMTLVALVAILGTLPARRQFTSSTEPARAPKRDFFRSMWESLRNPTFRTLLVSCMCIVTGLTLNGALLLHYLTYYVEIKGSVALSSSQVAFFGGGLLGTLFWLRISRKFDKRSLYVFSAAITSVLLTGGWPLFGQGHLFGTGDIRPLLAGYAITGFLNCVLWFVPPSMVADIADESELATGKRREGALFGIFSLSQQAAVGLAVVLAGVLLDQFVGLVPGQSQQSAQTVSRIGMAYSFVPAALLMAAAVLMLRYKLTRSHVEAIQAELQQRRSAQEVMQAGA